MLGGYMPRRRCALPYQMLLTMTAILVCQGLAFDSIAVSVMLD